MCAEIPLYAAIDAFVSSYEDREGRRWSQELARSEYALRCKHSLVTVFSSALVCYVENIRNGRMRSECADAIAKYMGTGANTWRIKLTKESPRIRIQKKRSERPDENSSDTSAYEDSARSGKRQKRQ